MDSIKDITSKYDPEVLKRNFSRANQRQKDQDENIKDHVPGQYKAAPKVTRYILTYDNARILFYKCYINRLGCKPELTENNKDVIKNILKWMLSEEDGMYPVNKGLFIFGDYGRGKTELFYTMKQFSLMAYRKFGNVIQLPNIQSYKFMVQKAKEQKSIKGLYRISGKSMIDDIGFLNETQLNIWGNNTDVISEIIESRYRTYKEDKQNISLFTSNLDFETIGERHGPGIMGRLAEMCTPIFWDGDADFRIQKK